VGVFTTQEASQFLHGKTNSHYHLSQKELNNVIGKTKKVKGPDGIMYGYRGELIRQSYNEGSALRMLWEYVEHGY